MSRKAKDAVRVSVVQAHLDGEREANLARLEPLVARAAEEGADVVLLPELFDGPYFPRTVDPAHVDRALPLIGHPTVEACRDWARRFDVVVPASFYERSGDRAFNSVAVVDAGGDVLGVYRKSHIPAGSGYEEKLCFAPGDTGFRVWETAAGRIGVGICWDQWFPEAARAMALAGAEIILYPSTIGSEPEHADMDTQPQWHRVMIGHAVANAVPVAASNRVGNEGGQRYYGGSFVADGRGEMIATLDRTTEGVATAAIDLEEARNYRDWFGLLRDRRPDLYASLTDED